MPFFSVIIPAYNAAHCIENALNSVAKQSYKDFEIIVVNDGSTDDTKAILKKWRSAHPDIKMRIKSQDNRGLGKSRNRATAMARGIFAALLDADDSWHPDKLKVVQQYLDKNRSVRAVFHKVEAVGLKQHKTRPAYLPKSVSELLIKGNPIVPSAFCMKRKMFKYFPFSQKIIFHGAEDLHLWIRLLLDKQKMGFIDEVLTQYTEDGGMSTKLAHHLRKVENVLQFFLETGEIDRGIYIKASRRKRYEAARFYHKRGLFRKAESFYTASQLKSFKRLTLQLLCFLGIAL
jgi:glycosyltransferase involved in cell wall biosynthesis